MKRVISLLCALIMLVSSFGAVTVFAADEATEAEYDVVTNPALEDISQPTGQKTFVMPDEGALVIEGEDLVDYDPTLFAVGSSTKASGGKYLGTTAGSSRTKLPEDIDQHTAYNVRLDVKINRTGEFFIWIRVPYGTSFWYGRGTTALTRAGGSSNYVQDGWCWRTIGVFNCIKGEDYTDFYVRWLYRYASFKLDKIIITDDHTFEPNGPDAYPTGDTTGWWPLPKFNPPEGHPRIMIHPDNHQEIRDRANTERYRSLSASLKKSGDSVTWESVTRKGVGDITGPTGALADRAHYYFLNPDDKEYAKETIALARQWAATAEIADSLRKNSSQSRNLGAHLRNLAEVYDYCYDQLTDDDKEFFIGRFKRWLAFLECGYPFSKGNHTLFGHTGEYMVFRDALAVGMAIYDEDPEVWNVYAGVFTNAMAPGRHWSLSSGAHFSGVMYGNDIRSYAEMHAQRLFIPWGLTEDDLFSTGWKDAQVRFLYLYLPSGEQVVEGENNIRTGDDVYKGSDINITTIPYLYPDYEHNLFINGERRKQALAGGSTSVSGGSWTEMLLATDPEETLDKFDFGNDEPLAMMGKYPFTFAIARTGWNMGEDSPDAFAYFNLREYAVELHYEPYIGDFQIYYKGWLAPKTGSASGGSGWAGINNRNYQRTSISHNCLSVVDPEELMMFTYYAPDRIYLLGNHGGQHGDVIKESRVTRKLDDILGENPKTFPLAKGEGRFLGPNKTTPKFTYIKADIAGAYKGRKVHKVDGRTAAQYILDEYGIENKAGEEKAIPSKFWNIYNNDFEYVMKLDEAKRSMVFLDLNNEDYPAAFIVFDKVLATDPTFDKNFVLHSVDGMEVYGNKIINSNTYKHRTGRQNNGKLVNTVLLPENPDIEVIGGPGREAEVDGVNFYGAYNPNVGHVSYWRAEVSPSVDEKETLFLNAMYVTDYDRNLPELPMIKETSATHVGVTVMDRVVMFSSNGYRVEAPFSMEIRDNNNGGVMSCMIADVETGKWTVVGGGKKQIVEVTEDEGTLYFEGLPGSYSFIPASSDAAVDQITYEQLSKEPMGDIVIWDEEKGLFRYNPVAPKLIDDIPYVGAEGFYEYYDGHEVKDNGDGSWNIDFHRYSNSPVGKGMHKSTTIWPGSTKAIVNGVERELASAPRIIDGVLYVNPADFPDSSPLIVKWRPELRGLYVLNNVNLAFLYEDLGGDYSKICDAEIHKYSTHISGAPKNMIDHEFGSKWATLGENWTTFKLSETKDLNSCYISYLGGNTRRSKFAVDVSSDGTEWKEVCVAETSGTTEEFERFMLEGADNVNYVRLRVMGNDENGYNNVTEFWLEAK